MSRYCLEVTYKAMPEWPGPERLDERLEALLGKSSNGSGYGMGCRDVTWGYASREKAEAAAQQVREYLKDERRAVYRRAKVNVYD